MQINFFFFPDFQMLFWSVACTLAEESWSTRFTLSVTSPQWRLWTLSRILYGIVFLRKFAWHLYLSHFSARWRHPYFSRGPILTNFSALMQPWQQGVCYLLRWGISHGRLLKIRKHLLPYFVGCIASVSVLENQIGLSQSPFKYFKVYLLLQKWNT